jgi:hypothetical protein
MNPSGISPVLLPTSYLPPVAYFAIAVSSEKAIIECHETYPRQTLRNRCCILAANGPLRLSIPVRGSDVRQKTGEKAVSRHSNWQIHHWRSICSAYNKAPFFIYYRDMLEPMYQKPFSGLLMDWNSSLIKLIAEEMGVVLQMEYTGEYLHTAAGVHDYRMHFDAGRAMPGMPEGLIVPPYYQVFEHKYGFIPNLSIVDLLFNMGPDASSYLQHIAAYMGQRREG